MWNFFRKNLILKAAIFATMILSACSQAPAQTGTGENTGLTDPGGASGVSSASEDAISSAVNFDHELDGYKPKKDYYNFYYTYKTVHPWWTQASK